MTEKKFFNLPKEAVLENYDDVRIEILNYFSGNEDIVSIYEYGSVSAPGVSDLDLIFVLKDIVSSNDDDFVFSDISSFAHDLVADGTVIKMPEAVFQQILYFDNLNFFRLTGKEIVCESPIDADDRLIKLTSIIDWVPERILKLTRILKSGSVNVTNALCVLHSFGYSLKSLNQLIGECEESDHLRADVAELRRDWYEFPDANSSLLDCIEKALGIGVRRLSDYEHFLSRGGEYLCGVSSGFSEAELELYDNHILKFKARSDLSVNTSDRCYEKDGRYVFELSSYFLPHFLALANFPGLLAENITKKLVLTGPECLAELSPCYFTNLERKMALAEHNAQFLRTNGLATGLIRYGFHF